MAGSYEALPACDAVSSHSPEATNVMVALLRVHTVPSPAVMTILTVSPDVAVAVGVYVSPTAGFDGIAEVNETDCIARPTTIALVALVAAT